MVHITRYHVLLSGTIIGIFTVLRVALDYSVISALQPESISLDLGNTRDFQDKEQIDLEESLPRDTSKSHKAKVLIVGYMRGGSSFVGDLFNQNRDSFYWYEPLDGVYSSLFGTPYGWIPLDITHTLEGDPRRLSITEENAIVQTLDGIYNCDFSNLPIEVLTHHFVDGVSSFSQSDFVHCLYQSESSLSKTSEECKSHLQSLCPQSFEDSRTYLCHEYLHKGLPNSAINQKLNKSNANQEDGDDNIFNKNQYERFIEHKHCLNSVRERVKPCLVHLEKQCLKSSAIVIKTIRLRMRTAELILKRFPELKVLHVLRDPVHTVLSRYRNKLMSAASGGMVITEAVVMCNKIVEDIESMQTLHRRNWPNFSTIYLDDFIEDPLGTLEYIYRNSLDAPRPPDVSLWIEQIYKNDGKQFQPCSNFSTAQDQERGEEFSMEYCYEGFLENLKKACSRLFAKMEHNLRVKMHPLKQ